MSYPQERRVWRQSTRRPVDAISRHWTPLSTPNHTTQIARDRILVKSGHGPRLTVVIGTWIPVPASSVMWCYQCQTLGSQMWGAGSGVRTYIWAMVAYVTLCSWCSHYTIPQQLLHYFITSDKLKPQLSLFLSIDTFHLQSTLKEIPQFPTPLPRTVAKCHRKVALIRMIKNINELPYVLKFSSMVAIQPFQKPVPGIKTSPDGKTVQESCIHILKPCYSDISIFDKQNFL